MSFILEPLYGSYGEKEYSNLLPGGRRCTVGTLWQGPRSNHQTPDRRRRTRCPEKKSYVSLKRVMMGTDLCGGHDRIVSARFSGDGGTKPVEGVVPFLLHSQHRGGQAHGWERKTFVKREEVLIFLKVFCGHRLP